MPEVDGKIGADRIGKNLRAENRSETIAESIAGIAYDEHVNSKWMAMVTCHANEAVFAFYRFSPAMASV
jgi:hypothetical protein